MTEFALKKIAVIFMLIAAIVLVGTASYIAIPRESTPDIKIPYIIVSTIYPGVSPSDIETLITNKLEKEFKGLEHLKVIRSSSGESYSSIVLEFNTGVDIENAIQKVRDKVSTVKTELPDDAEDPQVMEINLSEFPIMVVNISGPAGLVQLKEIGENLKDEMEALRGVLRVDLTGGLEKEVQVLVDAKKLKAYDLTIDSLMRSLQSENLDMPGGTIDMGSSKYLVRIPGEFKAVEEIADTVIKAKYGKIIKLKDIAGVQFAFKERASSSRLNKTDSVSLSVIKRSGENLISTAEEVKKIVNCYKLPKDTRIEILGDMSENIKDLVDEMESSLVAGLICVVFVLMLFMGFRNAVIVAMAIPFSFAIAVSVMNALGITLNMVVLFSLILALGMLVDNAIVVVENIYRHLQDGYPRAEAARLGATLVSMPILASTATTLAAFSPLLFWPGIMGEFMGYLPKTLITTLMASYFVAIIINPVLASKFMVLPKIRNGNNGNGHKIRHQGPIMTRYKAVLTTVLREPKLQGIIVAALVLMFITSLFSFSFIKKEFFPRTVPEEFYIYVNTPPGSTLDATDQIVKTIEKRLENLDDVKLYIANVGAVGAGTSFASGQADPTFAQIVVDLVDREKLKNDPFVIQARLREMVRDLAGASIKVESPQHGPPTGGAPVNIRVIGPEFDMLNSLSAKIQSIMKNIDGIADIRDDHKEGRPEIHISIDRSKASLLGVNTYQIASTVRSAVNGIKATTYRSENDEYDVIIRLDEKQRDSIADLEQLGIQSFKGDQPFIPLKSLARIETRGGYNTIPHRDLDRLITVQADVTGKLRSPQAIKAIDIEIKKMGLPAGYRVEYGGESEEMQKAFTFLGNAFMIAVILIFIILIALFNSFAYPLIIGSTIIMGIIGVAVGLGLTGNPFGMMAFVGLISLAGIVVNNAIVLIDYIVHLKSLGYPLKLAIITAGLTRFRPVMLTTITTILGLVPLTYGLGFTLMPPFIKFTHSNNTSFWGPMGSVVIFGLMIATFFTLIVVPMLFYLVDRIRTQVTNSYRRLST
ncbi:MAG: efflux RND transporter permease subunit [Candidatus Margulisiibacteriota bacterium]